MSKSIYLNDKQLEYLWKLLDDVICECEEEEKEELTKIKEKL